MPLKIRPYTPEDKAITTALQRAQLVRWHNREPEEHEVVRMDESYVATYVFENEKGEIVGVCGGRKIAEVGMTLDESKIPMTKEGLREFYDTMIAVEAKVVVDLYKAGYFDAVARIGPKVRKWGNTIRKRGGFRRLNGIETLWFDIKRACTHEHE